MDMLTWLKAFLAWYPSKFKAMIVVFLITGAALFLPASWQRAMEIYGLTYGHRYIEVGAFALTSVYLLVEGIHRSYERVHSQSRIKTRLQNLSEAESEALSQLTDGIRNTVTAWPHEPRVSNLAAEGIIEARPGAFTSGMRVYGLTPRVRKIYKKLQNRRHSGR